MMNQQRAGRMRFFDPQEDMRIVERRLPHWAQTATLCFITFRTWDSMPKSVTDRWWSERQRWLEEHGIDPNAADWKESFMAGEPSLWDKFTRVFSHKWHADLDACHGQCVLRRPELSAIVANALKRFDGERYDLSDFVVMPNHVHILAAFTDDEAMLTQCSSWKHFTAREINRQLGRKGRFWQQDAFDHLVRTEQQFAYLRQYIAENPRRAGLREGEFVHWTAPDAFPRPFPR